MVYAQYNNKAKQNRNCEFRLKSDFSWPIQVNHQNVHQSEDIKMEGDNSNCALGKRGEVRSVLICKAFFSRADFMKIKFTELSSQNMWIIPDLLEFVSMYQKNLNLYDTKFSNGILNFKSD